MAIRMIRQVPDPVLREKARVVTKIGEHTSRLIDDMLETMYYADGVGLAAPQIGISKRIIVIDVGDGPLALINPQIVSSEGEITEVEGCLSVPGVHGKVARAERVVVEAQDRNGQLIHITGEGLLAIALQHEIDHLDGILFVDKATVMLNPEDEDYEESGDKE